MAQKTAAELAQDLKAADQEYQFAMVAGDPARLVRALTALRQVNARYHAQKRKEFKKSFVSTVGK